MWKRACPRIIQQWNRSISVGDIIIVIGREIKYRLDAVYCDYSPSMATVKNLIFDGFDDFQRRTSVFDEPRPGALKTATTEDNVKKSTISC